ncbi:MAG: DNA repair protein RadA [Candidatus Aenigmatarchaeota archaeon]
MFYCTNCGYKSIKWLGRCPNCQAWEGFIEEKAEEILGIKKEASSPKPLKIIKEKQTERISTGFSELDSILGGGLVEGEVVLVGGEPGIGKSTLLLEVAGNLSKKAKTLYVSSEESLEQVGLRAKRLEINLDDLYILGEDNLEIIIKYIKEENFKFVIIDSIQVVYSSQFGNTKGSLLQLKGCADFLTQLAKSFGVCILIVGHVTKEGSIAGPKTLEHIVDCVLYFESETFSNYRILRATKNRFGPTGDISIFEMTSLGLKQVERINDIFLPHKKDLISGSCVICVIEGLRPILIELQSLVSRASFGVVRRRSLGFDFNRFSLLIAIIEKRLKFSLGSEDVFLNVAGGLKLTDPAADLGAIVAIVSSYKEKKVPLNSIFIGEVGLAGELRYVNNINLRLREIERANFKECFIPESNLKEVDKKFRLNIKSCSFLKEVIEEVFK